MSDFTRFTFQKIHLKAFFKEPLLRILFYTRILFRFAGQSLKHQSKFVMLFYAGFIKHILTQFLLKRTRFNNV